MYLLRLALASLINRRFTALLTVFAIALSVCLLLAVERVRTEARASFASTISGTDLIVGARSGSVNLLLYSVFRIGNATNNIRWGSFEHFAEHPQVDWAVPISLGDSHRGYRVLLAAATSSTTATAASNPCNLPKAGPLPTIPSKWSLALRSRAH